MVFELSDVLAGKSGVMAQWYQRRSIFMALEGVRRGVASTQMDAPGYAHLIGRAVDGLLPAVEKESHDDTRAIGLGCLTRWVLMLDAIPPQFLQSLKSSLGCSARRTSTIFAAAVCQLSGRAHFCDQLAPMVSDLLLHVDIGEKKANMFAAAVFSAKAVLDLAAVDTDCMNKVNAAFPWHALASPESFIFPSGVLTPQSADAPLGGEAAGLLAPHVCTAVCQVIALGAKHIAAARDGQLSAGVHPLSGPASVAIMQCAVSPSPEVRQAALEAVHDVCEVISGAQVTLLDACKQVIASILHILKYLPHSSTTFDRIYPTTSTCTFQSIYFIISIGCRMRFVTIGFNKIHYVVYIDPSNSCFFKT